MITLGLAWINAKYKHDYEIIFVATVLMDYMVITTAIEIFT